MTKPMKACKYWLAGLWFCGAGLILAVIIGQTLLGKYAGLESEAFGWLLPTVMPTLSLMLAVFISDALTGSSKSKRVEAFLYWLTMGISTFYLLVVSVTLFAASVSPEGPLTVMKKSNLFLGPIQGLAAAALGVFFVHPTTAANQGNFEVLPPPPPADRRDR